MDRYLVTGGAGFLGRYMVRRLRNKYVTVALDNIEPDCGGDPSFPHTHVDVTDFNKLEEAILQNGITHIIHLAAIARNLTSQADPVRAWEVNVTGTRNVLEIARRHKHPALIKRVVCCSSNIVLSPEVTVYKGTKLADEALVEMYSSLGVSCLALRPTNIYGAGQSGTEYQPCAFRAMNDAYEQSGHFNITGDGTQERDWIHADDVARAFEIASHSQVSGKSFDVSTGRLTTMNAIAQMLDVPVTNIPARPGDAKTVTSNPQKTKEVLGFESRIRLEDGIMDAFPALRLHESHTDIEA